MFSFSIKQLNHVSEVLAQREHANNVLNQQIQQLTNELKAKQEEFQQMQKSLNKQVISLFFSEIISLKH